MCLFRRWSIQLLQRFAGSEGNEDFDPGARRCRQDYDTVQIASW